MKLSKNTQVQQLEHQLNLRVAEITQAKEYIKELELVVEKSKDNIIFLKDLVLSKDKKYKLLSDTHITEYSKLAKELIAIRSNYNKMFTKQTSDNSKVGLIINITHRDMQVLR
jgi:hypothetical protein